MSDMLWWYFVGVAFCVLLWACTDDDNDDGGLPA